MEMKSKPKKRVSLAERLAEVQVPPKRWYCPCRTARAREQFFL